MLGTGFRVLLASHRDLDVDGSVGGEVVKRRRKAYAVVRGLDIAREQLGSIRGHFLCLHPEEA